MIIFTMQDEFNGGAIDRQCFVDEGDAIAALRAEYGEILDPDADDLDEIMSDLSLVYPDVVFEYYYTGGDDDED